MAWLFPWRVRTWKNNAVSKFYVINLPFRPWHLPESQQCDEIRGPDRREFWGWQHSRVAGFKTVLPLRGWVRLKHIPIAETLVVFQKFPGGMHSKTPGSAPVSVQDWSPHMSFILKLALEFHLFSWRVGFKSKTSSIQEYRNEIQNS